MSSSPFSLQLALARLKRLDFIVVYSALLVLAILLLIVVFAGEATSWSRALNKPNINSWFVRALWILGTIFSYVTFFFIWQDIREHEIPRDLIVSTLFVITSFLFLAWGIVYYYAENITLALWIVIIIFIYNVWLLIYVWYIRSIAALFLIPNILLYIYLLNWTIYIASAND